MRLWAQIARLAKKKNERKKKEDPTEVLIPFCLREKQQTYSYIWQEFKVLLEMWRREDIVGRKFIIFLYPGGNARRAARWDLAYLEQCVYDLCSNGILIDTMGAGDILRLPTDDATATTNKNKATQCPVSQTKCPFFLPITPAIIYIIPFSPVQSPTLLHFAHCGFKAKSISQ